MKKTLSNPIWFTSIIALGTMTENVAANTVIMQKQNTYFSIDGHNGAKQGQQIFLYETDTNNVNQQWIETSIDGGYFTIKKKTPTFVLMVAKAVESAKQ